MKKNKKTKSQRQAYSKLKIKSSNRSKKIAKNKHNRRAQFMGKIELQEKQQQDEVQKILDSHPNAFKQKSIVMNFTGEFKEMMKLKNRKKRKKL